MSIKVLVPTIVLLSVAYVEPTAQVSYVEPVATATYVEAYAQPSWVDVQVVAEVTMPDVLAVDIINPQDSVSVQTIKAFADMFGVSEQNLTKVVQKVFAEAVTPTDVVNILLIYQRTFADTFAALDAVSLGITKPLADLISDLDAITVSANKGLSDSITELDSLAFATSKSLADTFLSTDLVALSTSTSLADSFSEADLIVLEAIKGLSDSFTNADSLSFSNDKALTDVVGMLDNMDTDIQYTIIKTISELIYTADANIIESILGKADSTSLSSSGSLLAQGYCDITYFLEDYVGSSRTFT